MREGNGIVVEAVTKENYKQWSALVENYLRGKGIWDVVDGAAAEGNSESKDENNDLKTNASTGQRWKRSFSLNINHHRPCLNCAHLPSIFSTEEINDWRKDAKALHIIQLACGSEHLSKIRNCKTAKEAWNKLQGFFSEVSKTEQNYGTTDDEKYKDIYKYVEEGDPKGLEGCGELSEAITSTSFPRNSTLIHVAVIADHVEIVEALVNQAPKELLLYAEDDDGYTPLALAAAFTGNERVAELLITKEEQDKDKDKDKDRTSTTVLGKKAEKGEHQGLIPVVMAATMGHKDMTRYLYAQTTRTDILHQNNYEHAASLLHTCINSEIFDVVLHLLQIHCPKMPLFTPGSDGACRYLQALAQMPSAFESGNQYGWLRRRIYNNLRVPNSIVLKCYVDQKDKRKINVLHDSPSIFPITITVTSSHKDLNQSHTNSSPGFVTLEKWLERLSKLAPLKILGALLRVFINLPCIKKFSAIEAIYDRKLLHHQVLQIVRCLCERISEFDRSKLREVSAYDAMLQAAKNGIIEFLKLMSDTKRELLWESVDQSKRGIFAHAIMNRRHEVFELIHKLNGRKKKITCSKDAFGNNLLHLAALVGPSSDLDRRFGAALQMQRELQWFKAVQKNVHPRCEEETNDDGEKPREVFAKCHKELVKDAEKWAKDTASSFIIVGALIITIIFAAAFTLPGGNNQNSGKPMFLKEKEFTAFIMADAFALFTSSSSVLIFIWVLTSRYSEKDFLIDLPCKLFFGLLTLSISVVSMFGAFCIAFFMMLKGYPYVTWTSMVLAVATVVLILVPSQFRLFCQILGSTVGFKPIQTEDKHNTCWPLRFCHNVLSVIRFCIGF